MEKLFYLIFDEANSDSTRLRESLIDEVVPVLRRLRAEAIGVFVSDEAVAAGKPTRQSDPPIRAALSFVLADVESRGAAEAAIRPLAVGLAGYLVRESRPIVHERNEAGRLPGMMQLTCITARPEIGMQEFHRIWHEDHLRVAVETQATFGYVRNQIIRPITEGAPEHWAGIVEETFPIEALDDPMVFFNAKTPAELSANLGRMVKSCQRFLDLENLEVTFMSEYYFE
jgi:hypothetical protein